MNHKPTIVFCTTCKGRGHHIERTLPANLRDNADYPSARFLVLDYGSKDGLADYILERHKHDLQNGRLVYYHHDNGGQFQMAHAKNMAHRLGLIEGSDILVNLDADNFTGQGFASWIVEQACRLTHDGIPLTLPSPARGEVETTLGSNASPISSPLRGEDKVRVNACVPINFFLWCNAKSVTGRARQGLAGRIGLSRDLFLKTGGYDERYTTWAPEDVDLKERVWRLGYKGVEIPDRFLYVIPHRDALRFKEYPDAKPLSLREEQDRILQIQQSQHTIANYGKIGLGTATRNFGQRQVVLRPLPTRIFGVGMQKTATTSLHEALTILGFDSWHWSSPLVAKTIWQEMNAHKRSITLERHYALSDNPIPLLFEKLDAAYPGSKFILTVRNEHDWLKSVRDHWNPKLNPWRHTWDKDAFTHGLHRIIYGTRDFCEDLFLRRYRAHNADVRAYFKARPDDLLVLDVDAPGKWESLCRFLGTSVPGEKYPHKMRTERK